MNYSKKGIMALFYSGNYSYVPETTFPCHLRIQPSLNWLDFPAGIREKPGRTNFLSVMHKGNHPDLGVYNFIKQLFPLDLFTTVEDKILIRIPDSSPIQNYYYSPNGGSCN
jgi:hypothetical protein